MLEKIFIITVMVAILFALGSGLFFLVKDDGKSERLLKALTIRIGLSLLLFFLMLFAFFMGWIHPHGLT